MNIKCVTNKIIIIIIITPRARVTKKLLVELGLVDVWRVLHPTDKQFPFYSASQVAYSRIDNFLFIIQIDIDLQMAK